MIMMEDLGSKALLWKEAFPCSPCKYLVILMYLCWAYSRVSPMLTLFNCGFFLFVYSDVIYLSMDTDSIASALNPSPFPFKKK